MKRQIWLLLAMMAGLSCLIFSACPTGNENESLWLTDLDNPFIGKWKSDLASDGTRLTFTGNTNGTFEYEMEGVPEEMGLPNEGNGVYIIRDDMLVAYFDFGLVKGIVFDVVDNDTIAMKEFMLNENDGTVTCTFIYSDTSNNVHGYKKIGKGRKNISPGKAGCASPLFSAMELSLRSQGFPGPSPTGVSAPPCPGGGAPPGRGGVPRRGRGGSAGRRGGPGGSGGAFRPGDRRASPF
jgi:hypothetical protein